MKRVRTNNYQREMVKWFTNKMGCTLIIYIKLKMTYLIVSFVIYSSDFIVSWRRLCYKKESRELN